MALAVTLAQHSSATHPDKVSLQVDSESTGIARNPSVVPLPGGSIFALDLGKRMKTIVLTGVVDTLLTELTIASPSGAFTAGRTITGAASWDTRDSPEPSRAATPTAVIVAGAPNLTSPTSLIVSGLSGSEYFINGETITESTSGVTATILEAMPSKARLEQIVDYWYAAGPQTLVTPSGTYTVRIKDATFEVQGGLEDRYNFKLTLVRVA